MQEYTEKIEQQEITETAYWECSEGYFPKIPITDASTQNLELVVKQEE